MLGRRFSRAPDTGQVKEMNVKMENQVIYMNENRESEVTLSLGARRMALLQFEEVVPPPVEIDLGSSTFT